MKKYLGYIPAVFFLAFYLFSGLTGVSMAMGMILIWLACFLIAAVLLHKGILWGGIFGVFPALHMIYRGGSEILVGAVLLLFYGGLSVYLWKKRDADAPAATGKEVLVFFAKIILTVLVIVASGYIAVIGGMILIAEGIHQVFAYIGMLVIPSLCLPLIWLKKRKKFLIIWLIPAVIYFISLGVHYGLEKYDQSITINTAPNINVHEYLPFREDSKIVKIDSETLKLTDDLPVIDGAAAFFPVYSAFVNAVYPETTELYDGVFEYNNTPGGYALLAEKRIDLFLGVYPSEEQKAYAEEQDTTFVYTPVGTEAFVFFVHKDNPIDNLTTEQIKGIYSGEITNWKQVGGKNEEIAAFQRNEGSGSQSMLQRFMGDTPIMEAPTELRNDLMSGIIEQVSNYRSKSNSIGFSFRYYVEGIIQNPDIKVLSVDGVAPTAENIRNGSYPIVTPMYAVTYEENSNENVDLLLEWILSEEGQYIIEETGYVGISN
ncbi:MAG: substrate-binding domain-containing protein [Oscillospiraceae bacterium]|nr:substrate-binding domain-containing protein [Oscillospiraceae bacterium]MBQ7001509.1 substrate-binding domain-containing protein [Oscillospiraceae bacterium]MBQ9839599.1 substrate-binding domain-containing protein [Oscillospiraceae bacterium]